MRLNRPALHTKRYRQIAHVLVRNGLGYFVDAFDLYRFVPLHRGGTRGQREQTTQPGPEHVRAAFEELGATFIKFGQMLSTRSDLLPPEYLEELAKLQDAAPHVAWDDIQETIVEELGYEISEVFAEFDPEPLAAASIGQAHAAMTLDGQEVVVKVRRPGVVEQIHEDLEILRNLAVNASRHWDVAEEYDLVGLVQEFSDSLRTELDYLLEAQHAEQFAANFASDPSVHIPKIFWGTTTSRVITMERLRGIKINDLAALDAAGIDRPALAERIVRINFKMMFEDGLFHADPHPGNFFIEAGGRIGLLDFGLVGRVDEETQRQLVHLLFAVTSRDTERLVDAVLDIGITRKRVDRRQLHADIQRLMLQYYDRPLGDIEATAVINQVLSIVRRHHLQLPSKLLLLLKTVIMNESLAVDLDPDFRVVPIFRPYVQQLMYREYSPRTWAKRLGRAGLEAAQLGVELPQHVRRIVSDIERGEIEIGVRPERFEPLMERVERLANRIVLGILAAAFINALAVLLSFYQPAGWSRWSELMFGFGFLVALVLGVYLAWTILRSGRRR